MLFLYSNRLAPQSWNTLNGITQKLELRGSWTSSTTDNKRFYSEPDVVEYGKTLIAKVLLRTWCGRVQQTLKAKGSIRNLMGLSTTRIVSCNMTSFLVLNHERVRYCNGLWKPNDNLWWDHLANDSINHLPGASTLRLQKLDNSLAKEPISTHAKQATWTLDTKDNK